MGEQGRYKWTNLVAIVICQARSDGSLDKAVVSRDRKLWVDLSFLEIKLLGFCELTTEG